MPRNRLMVRAGRVSIAFARHALRTASQKPRGCEALAVEILESRVLLSSTWYVAPSGQDSNPGTLVQPFQTIQQAANEAQAGDTVMIRAGVYHETVNVPNSGMPGQPIVFEPYHNESVTLDGADPITAWTQTGNSVWHAPVGWDLGSGNNQVFVDGHAVNDARWPNTTLDLSHPILASFDSASATSTTATIQDNALTQPADFWDGATIQFGAGQNWVKQSGTVTASGPGWLTFSYVSSGSYGMPSAGNSYFLSGIAGALDAPGEFFKSADGPLSLWTPDGDSPSNHVVEVKARAYAFDLSQASNIRIEGINLFAATINTSGASRNVYIDRITAEYVSQFNATADGWLQPRSGILLTGPFDTLANSVIAYSAGDGVYIGGFGSRVLNNIIHDVDSQGGDSAGIVVDAQRATVDHNTVYNCGRDGILVVYSRGKITSNIVHDFGLLTTDCGGIYAVHVNGRGTEIASNTVYNGVTGGFGGVGIYLDNGSSNFVVDHNITYAVNCGLKLNLSSLGDSIYNNTFDATQYGLSRIWGAYDWTGTTLANNIFTRRASFGLNASMQNNLVDTGYSGYFVDGANGNFALDAGSQAIGVGNAPDAGALDFGQESLGNGVNISLVPVDPSTPMPVVSGNPSGPPVPPTPSVPPQPVISPTPPPIPPTVPTTGIVMHDARVGITAIAFDASQGNESPSEGGLGYLFGGNWVKYAAVDFGTNVSQVQFQFALRDKYAGQHILLRVDSLSGPAIGMLTTVGTGGWGIYAAQTAAVTSIGGIHDLYLCMAGNGPMGNIQSFQFS